MTHRPGFALAVSLLLVVVLAALGAAMLALGAREAEIAAAMARRSHARAAAELAVRWELATWSTRRHGQLAIGASSAAEAAVADGRASTVVTRLEPGLFLVQGTGRDDSGWGAAARAGLLVRTLDPVTLALAFPTAVVARDSALVIDGEVLGPEACADGAAVGADATILVGELPPMPDPDPFRDPWASDLATVTMNGGSVAPRPWVGAGGCIDHPLNWGAASPTSLCHDRRPFVRAVGDLAVVGGEARALLVVQGDVRLADVRFHGLVLADGRVTIAAGTALRGAVRAPVIEVRGGSVIHDPCEVAAALSAGGLDGPFLPAGRWWIPLF